MENFMRRHQHPATPEEIWAILRENAIGMAELREEQRKTDLQMKETALQMKETDRQMKETDRIVKENALHIEKIFRKIDKQDDDIGGLRNSVGWLVESFFHARMWELLKDSPYNFNRCYRRVEFFDDCSPPNCLGDIDILLSDTEWVMAIEVKSFAMEKDLTRFLNRLESVRKHPPAEARGKKILAGFAAVGYDKDVCNGVHEAGLFAFSINDDLGKLLPPPEGFTPSVWDTAAAG
ncbi:MAG: hypothetical protein FWG66_05770 [Spirochaetes bacterium]|nr:hypothetical protein [Spirochaetota bacterium]